MDRVILHCDCNGYYASVEELLNPKLKQVPMAVAGDPKCRHGVIVAKNALAKKFGVQTGDNVYTARQKCRDIVFVTPHHDLYYQISKKVNAIYLDYTDLVDPFGIDESFLDLTPTMHLFRGKTPKDIADEIRDRVRNEIGITVSVGVSFCRVFAKVGSDYEKPDATTVIMREDVERIAHPLPVSAMLYAGRKSTEKLEMLGITTIGALARADKDLIVRFLGAPGEQLWRYANSLDDEPVRSYYTPREVKSVGRGMTFRRDIYGEDEVRCAVFALADPVCASLRHEGKLAGGVSVQVKDPNFKSRSKQILLKKPTHLQKEVAETAYELMVKNWNINLPIRSITVTCIDLCDEATPNSQMTMFDEADEKRERQEKIEDAMAGIRAKMGRSAIRFGYYRNEEIGVGDGKPHHGDEPSETE
ncbi:MAG: DNA polymerase IV [Clostridia bacterium]|nr:DNA polymerase IV [Clostridia bacterium]